jgi:hypothetical protein
VVTAKGSRKGGRQAPALRGLLVPPLIKASISVFIALVGALLFYLSDLRHWGADLSQSVYVQFAGGGLGSGRSAANRRGGDALSATERWTLVDIGPRFCEQASDAAASICPPETARTDPRAVARLLRWVAAQRPRMIVVDIEAIRSVEELRYASGLLRTLGRARLPSILVALPFEERGSADGKQPAILVDPRTSQMLAASFETPFRFHPTQIRAPAPVARTLLTQVRVLGDPSLGNLDTLSFAAARTVRGNGSDAAGHGASADARHRGGEGSDCNSLAAPRCRSLYELSERAFSFRPVTAADDPDARVEIDYQAAPGFQYAYVPAPAPWMLDRVPADGPVRDSIVLIGDTRYSAQDRPWTAIGDVSGAELQLNDVRQFWMARPAPDTLASYMWGEMPLVASGFLVVLLVEALLAERRARRPKVEKTSFRYPLQRLWSLLFIGMGSTMVAMVFILAHRSEGRATDFVTPFLCLLVFTLLEFFISVVGWVEARFGHEPG